MVQRNQKLLKNMALSHQLAIARAKTREKSIQLRKIKLPTDFNHGFNQMGLMWLL